MLSIWISGSKTTRQRSYPYNERREKERLWLEANLRQRIGGKAPCSYLMVAKGPTCR